MGGGAAGSRRGGVRDRRQRGARSGRVVRGGVRVRQEREGLHLVAHAGEGTSAQSIWAALELGAERIGHGISAIEDAALMRHLRERGIPLEICITSNLVTGVVKRVEDHPVRRLFDAGVPITLNTDDPAMFGCTLVGEYELAKTKFGFTEAELESIAKTAFQKSFGPRMDTDKHG